MKLVEIVYVKVKELYDGNLSDSLIVINFIYVIVNDFLGFYVIVKGFLGNEVKFDSEWYFRNLCDSGVVIIWFDFLDLF